MENIGVNKMARDIVQRDQLLMDMVFEFAHRLTPYSDFYIKECQPAPIKKAMDMVGIDGKQFPVVCTVSGKHTLPIWSRGCEQWADRMNHQCKTA